MRNNITVLGLGSLLSQASAQRTCPTLENFRIVELVGFKRVFNKTDSDRARKQTIPPHNQYACLSAIPSQGTHMLVSAFEIPASEWLPFVKREFEYRLKEVSFHETDGRQNTGILCVGDFKTDEECALGCATDPFRLACWQDFTHKFNGPMWRKDLLPDQEYLKNCLNAARHINEDVYTNFIQTTFLGDGSTSIQTYLNL